MRMFCRSLMFAAALGAVAVADGQAQTIGFKLGPSFSRFSGDDLDDQKTLTKFPGGGFVRFGMGGFAIQPELMYVTKGTKFSETDEDFGTLDVEFRLDYIEIPVLFVVPFAAGPSISPFVYAGPAFSFEVGCKVAVEVGDIDGSSDCDEPFDGEDLEFERNKFDVGAMIGGGVAIPMGPGAVTLEGRYNFGLMNLLKDSSNDEKLRNRSGAVLIGYSIPLGVR